MTYEVYLIRRGDPICVLGTVEADGELDAEALASDKFREECSWIDGESLEVQEVRSGP